MNLGKLHLLPRYLWGSLEARDPLQWHILGFSLGVFSRSEPNKEPATEKEEKENESTPGSVYYLYNRYKLGLSLSYLRDAEFTEIGQAYLTYISPGRFLSLQTLFGYKHEEHFQSSKVEDIRLNKEYILGGPAMILLLGDTHIFHGSISPERGWSIYAEGSHYTQANSKLISSGSNSFPREEAISYGLGEGGLALYLPSFFQNHVNYLSVYSYSYFGSHREQRIHKHRNLVRNADPQVFEGENFSVYSYEYRFPYFLGCSL